MKKTANFLLIILAFLPAVGFSQSTTVDLQKSEILKGLRIETKQDSIAPSMKLDGSVPIYDQNGTKIGGMEVIKAMQSGSGIPVRYLNDKKEVMAYVLRPTTEEEKIKLQAKLKSKQEDNSKTAKPFTVQDMDGKSYSLNELKGKIVVLNFWFVECMPCRKEIPELNALVKKYTNENIVFLAISTSEKSKILKFRTKTDFKYTIIPKEGNNKVIEDYAINSYPTHIIIDKESKVKFYAVGLNDQTIASLTKEIDSLLK
ncbi:TlpA family protein disulfide reductase [Flavobacterium nackdongense]|uniref:TlpA family protein disulfide reductase n=1 Tax=Flavobacterium nackdongense TaxID=2547394 RepID=A0A4P6YBK1_9FLAO|nr:TlpA disulfide reductase family protein [Flavobacterium nackdongense]QBN20449.1 TlpA family protein disulfide reductase [Flavobacterium nackdongense]